MASVSYFFDFAIVIIRIKIIETIPRVAEVTEITIRPFLSNKITNAVRCFIPFMFRASEC